MHESNVFFSFFLSSSLANACLRYPVRLGKGSEDKTNANSVIIVTAQKVEGKTYLIADEPWGNVKFTGMYPCGVSVENKEKYILLSCLKFEELKKQKVGLSNVSLIKLSAESVKEFLNAESLPDGQPNYLWRYCSKDVDCVAAKNGCAVNSNFLNN